MIGFVYPLMSVSELQGYLEDNLHSGWVDHTLVAWISWQAAQQYSWLAAVLCLGHAKGI